MSDYVAQNSGGSGWFWVVLEPLEQVGVSGGSGFYLFKVEPQNHCASRGQN